MWEISILNQVTTFLLSVVIGICFCLLYDVCKIIRMRYDIGAASVFLVDILYFAVIGVFEFCFFLATCSGEIRGFVFIGNVIGFVLCRVTLSKIFVVICGLILDCLYKVFSFFERIIRKPIIKIQKYIKIFIKTVPKKRFFRKKVLKND